MLCGSRAGCRLAPAWARCVFGGLKGEAAAVGSCCAPMKSSLSASRRSGPSASESGAVPDRHLEAPDHLPAAQHGDQLPAAEVVGVHPPMAPGTRPVAPSWWGSNPCGRSAAERRSRAASPRWPTAATTVGGAELGAPVAGGRGGVRRVRHGAVGGGAGEHCDGLTVPGGRFSYVTTRFAGRRPRSLELPGPHRCSGPPSQPEGWRSPVRPPRRSSGVGASLGSPGQGRLWRTHFERRDPLERQRAEGDVAGIARNQAAARAARLAGVDLVAQVGERQQEPYAAGDLEVGRVSGVSAPIVPPSISSSTWSSMPGSCLVARSAATAPPPSNRNSTVNAARVACAETGAGTAEVGACRERVAGVRSFRERIRADPAGGALSSSSPHSSASSTAGSPV